MTIEHTRHAQGSTAAMLTECPVQGCEETFERDSGNARRVHFLNDHTPEDFNLD